ncbi:uncharacterized protein LOC9658301 isoform X1 [Selaginella moellendorffii]|uniref:uncharacterized protein LOC9658301 isoform X1 n=1 Tax=Selaginella moellendorffii TaxID=88036 RepID=UPI000D1C8A96|nr:uncharacterized protein LOC9658301 isoform X1 [Selaginella moellendorffii]XP_024541765.1 uncharacterized protein LOC9658301 isoform X1 [Selaginella moellendorffii]XP_024541766.1 uncharacterized protein LOC9658301 isoform X1 [Selaginella moellendorffii]|eukprot:XP_024541764.1 uncharacterized protein LOC9658301 isoform X1 [Selaginella moellendorffii]
MRFAVKVFGACFVSSAALFLRSKEVICEDAVETSVSKEIYKECEKTWKSVDPEGYLYIPNLFRRASKRANSKLYGGFPTFVGEDGGIHKVTGPAGGVMTGARQALEIFEARMYIHDGRRYRVDAAPGVLLWSGLRRAMQKVIEQQNWIADPKWVNFAKKTPEHHRDGYYKYVLNRLVCFHQPVGRDKYVRALAYVNGNKLTVVHVYNPGDYDVYTSTLDRLRNMHYLHMECFIRNFDALFGKHEEQVLKKDPWGIPGPGLDEYGTFDYAEELLQIIEEEKQQLQQQQQQLLQELKRQLDFELPEGFNQFGSNLHPAWTVGEVATSGLATGTDSGSPAGDEGAGPSNRQ